MQIKITMTRESWKLKDGCKTAYKLIDTSKKEISEKQVNNIIDSIPFFKSLGGSEHKTMGYTCMGYNLIELVSKSPDRQQKTVRKFNYEVV